MNHTQGFSLIEVMIASAVLVTVLLGVAGMCLTAQGHLRHSGDQTVATTLCQQRVEWLRNQGYNSTDLAAGTVTETLSGVYAGYTRTTLVQSDSPRAGVKQITVSTQTAAGHSVQVVTLIAE